MSSHPSVNFVRPPSDSKSHNNRRPDRASGSHIGRQGPRRVRSQLSESQSMNVARYMLSKFQLCAYRRSSPFQSPCHRSMPAMAATPEAQPHGRAHGRSEAGKDVVHQLNNAFARVFEPVAPSVVIIEVSKKNDGSEGFSFDDLFFQGPPDENNPHRNPRRSRNRFKVRAPGSSFGRTVTSSPTFTSSKAPTRSR